MLLLRRRLRKLLNRLVSKFLSSVFECYYMGKLPGLNIGGLEIESCVIQGGMGVGVSRAGLASAVAKEGGRYVLLSTGHTATTDTVEQVTFDKAV